jgi:hypothetical protein
MARTEETVLANSITLTASGLGLQDSTYMILLTPYGAPTTAALVGRA